MEYTEFKQLFKQALHSNNLLELDESATEAFYRFNTQLLETNKTTNLTAIRNMADVIAKHDIDSLFASEYIPQNARVLDLGCGPGFPSIPLAIARPDLTIIALDSTAKKIAFVNESAKQLGLTNLKTVTGRAEDPTLAKQLGKFAVVVSRAVARMNVLCELCLPYVQIKGMLLAMKAARAEEEANEAAHAVAILGGEQTKLHYKDLTLLDGSKETRCLIEIQKSKTTPSTHPRAYATILKKPL